MNVAVYWPGSAYVWVAFAVVASTVPSDVKSHAYVIASPSGSLPVPVKFTVSGAEPATLSACADAVGVAFDATPLADEGELVEVEQVVRARAATVHGT